MKIMKFIAVGIFILYFLLTTIVLLEFSYENLGEFWQYWLGFFGAILGGIIAGYVTLSGVKKTINFTKDIEVNNKRPEKIKAAHKLIKSLNAMQESLNVKDYEYETKRKTLMHLKDELSIFFEEDDLFIYAAMLNQVLYKEFVGMEKTIIRKHSISEAEYRNITYLTITEDEKRKQRVELTKNTFYEIRLIIFRFASEVDGYLEELIES